MKTTCASKQSSCKLQGLRRKTLPTHRLHSFAFTLDALQKPTSANTRVQIRLGKRYRVLQALVAHNEPINLTCMLQVNIPVFLLMVAYKCTACRQRLHIL